MVLYAKPGHLLRNFLYRIQQSTNTYRISTLVNAFGSHIYFKVVFIFQTLIWIYETNLQIYKTVIDFFIDKKG